MPAGESQNLNADSLTIVGRIDSLDVQYSQPLQEFLAKNGVTTILNSVYPSKANYHLIIGDPAFVKKIILNRRSEAKRTLILLWGTQEEVQLNLPEGTLLVLLDPIPLTAEAVRKIFAFFFTRRLGLLDLRQESGVKSLTPLFRPTSITKTTRADQDQKRIDTMLKNIFSAGKKSNQLTGWKGKILTKKSKNLSVLAILLTLLILLPPLWYLLNLSFSLGMLGLGSRMALNNQTNAVKITLNLSEWAADQASFVLSLTGFWYKLAGREKQLRSQEELLTVSKDAAEAERESLDIVEEGRVLANLLLSTSNQTDQTISPAAQLQELRTNLYALENQLGLVSAQLTALIGQANFPFSLSFVNHQGQQQIANLNRVRTDLATIEKLTTIYPLMAGFKQPQTYLVLLENNNELRPTGGFIGSVATLSLTGGRMTDLKVQDVYALDGQLKGHVDPPRPIREILGQEHWYLRDSNWDPNFAYSAAQAAWFYEKESGQQVDGVIGLTTQIVVDLLKITGPVSLPDYNDRITAENFFGKSLYYPQTDFFPGSTQKKDFLGSLTTEILNRLTTGQSVPPTAVFRVLSNALNRRDLMFYFTDDQLETLVSQVGWAGIVPRLNSCYGKENCLAQDLVFVEANLGVSKANYFIKRQIDYQINVSDSGLVNTDITLNYHNNFSPQSQTGGGNYRNYLRFLLPTESVVDAVLLKGQEVPLRSTRQTLPPNLPYAEENVSGNQRTFAVVFDVPPGAEVSLNLKYHKTQALIWDQNMANYELYLYEQPGISANPWQVTLNYPLSWTVATPKEAAFLAKPGQLKYNTTLLQDQLFNLQLSK